MFLASNISNLISGDAIHLRDVMLRIQDGLKPDDVAQNASVRVP